jgi:predicted AAA+ superfamily ATPase
LGENADLERILTHGTIPAHYDSTLPDRDLKAYIGDYVEEEIRKEARLRNIPSFFRFLEWAGRTSGELINYANIGRECGISPKTVREYYQILEDTMLGFRLPPWRSHKERRLIETEKFYLFDCGVSRYLKRISHPEPGTDVYGHLFEAFFIQELRAYLSYREKLETMTYWRTSTMLEVDLILGDMAVAIEFKSQERIQPRDLRGLRALAEEFKPGRKIIVCREPQARQTEDGIEILPWQKFCKMLWSGQIQ